MQAGASRAVRRCRASSCLLGAAGTIGGGIAGLVVGLFYGFAGASQPLQPGMGAVSVLLVLVCLSIIAALIGAVGISLGIAAAGFARNRWPWTMLGGALGGLVVGAFAKLLGIDAFNLLLGQSPGDITGAGEGALLGARDRAWRLARPARGRAASPASRHRHGRPRRRGGRGRHSAGLAGG